MVLLFSPLPGLVAFFLQLYVKKFLFFLFSFLCFMEFLCRIIAAFLFSFLFLCREKVILCLFLAFFRIKGNEKEKSGVFIRFCLPFLWGFFFFLFFYFFLFRVLFDVLFAWRVYLFFILNFVLFFLSSFFLSCFVFFFFFMQKEIQKVFRNDFKKGRKGKRVCEFEMEREFLFVFNLLRNSKSTGNGKAY